MGQCMLLGARILRAQPIRDKDGCALQRAHVGRVRWLEGAFMAVRENMKLARLERRAAFAESRAHDALGQPDYHYFAKIARQRMNVWRRAAANGDLNAKFNAARNRAAGMRSHV